MDEPSDEMCEAIRGTLERVDSIRLELLAMENNLLAIRNRHAGLGITSWHERFGDGSDTVAP